jgi:hypothetical protein
MTGALSRPSGTVRSAPRAPTRGRLSESEVRLYGWYLVVVAKLVVVVTFHVWSLSVGRGGLGPVVIGGDDGDLYLYVAEYIANTGVAPAYGVYVWPVLVGEIMAVTGIRGTLVFKAILFVASLLGAWVGVRLLRRLSADVLRRPAPAFAEVVVAGALVLFPSTLWIASYSIYRDAVIYALAVVAVYAAYEVLVGRKRAYLLLFVPTVWALFQFRWYAAVAVGVGALLWFPLTGGLRRDALRRLAGVAAVGGVFAAAVQFGLIGEIQEVIVAREYFEIVGGGSNIGVSYSRSNVATWPFLFLYSFASNVLGPLPNQISGFNTVVGFVLEIPLLSFVLWRVARSPVTRQPGPLLLVSVAVCWFVLIAIYNDNVGTALRLRVFGYQFLFLVAVLDGVARRASRRPARGSATRAYVRPPAQPA